MANRIQMKAEAVQRMKMHGLLQDIIDLFNEKDILCCSENGILRYLTGEEKRMVAEYEKESGCLIYHIIRSHWDFETCELCQVSLYKEDWPIERDRLEQGWPLVYSVNLTIPDYSETGGVALINSNGSLIRIR